MNAANHLPEGVVFEPEAMKYLFDQLATKNNIKVYFHTMATAMICNHKQPECVITESKSGRNAIKGRNFYRCKGTSGKFDCSKGDNMKANLEVYREYFYFSGKVLILLEHEEQIKSCIGWLNEIKGQKQVIALSPFAMHELNKHNTPYKIIEDYYDPQELYQLGIANYQKVEEICGVIDKKIQKACPITAEIGITPALFSFYYLKIIYDAVTIRIFQLSKLIEAEKPDVIFIYNTKKYHFGVSDSGLHLLFDNRESIYAHLLALDGWNVPVVMLPAISQPEDSYVQRENYQTISDRLKKKAVGWLQTHPQLFNLAMMTRKSGWHGLFSELKSYLHANKHMPALLFGGGYNWGDCREELQSEGIRIIIKMQDDLNQWMSGPFSNEVDSATLLNAWYKLQADDEFRRFFVWANIDFFPVVEERLQFLIQHLIPACLNAYEEAEELLKKKKIRAVLSSTISACTGSSVSQAARNLDVPVILWQHGAYGYFDWIMGIYDDIIPSDALFVFGKGTVEKYRMIAKRYNTQILSIGSSSLEKLYEGDNLTKAMRYVKLSPNKKVIVYATTNFYQNSLYISWPPLWSDNSFWQTQQSIIDVLGKYSECNVIVKMHPNIMHRETPVRLYAKEKGFENCLFIRNECSFTDLLSLADVIIIDFPSTVLLQSLTTKKPIFALLKHLKIDDDAQDLLKRRAYCYSDLNEFTKALDTFLSSGSISTQVDLKDREFLKRYGTHLADGKSGVRAANMLRNIINERNVGGKCKQKTM